MPISKQKFSEMKDKELDLSAEIKDVILELLKTKPDCYFSKTEIMMTLIIPPGMSSDVLDSLVRERKILEQQYYKKPYYIVNPDILIKKK